MNGRKLISGKLVAYIILAMVFTACAPHTKSEASDTYEVGHAQDVASKIKAETSPINCDAMHELDALPPDVHKSGKVWESKDMYAWQDIDLYNDGVNDVLVLSEGDVFGISEGDMKRSEGIAIFHDYDFSIDWLNINSLSYLMSKLGNLSSKFYNVARFSESEIYSFEVSPPLSTEIKKFEYMSAFGFPSWFEVSNKEFINGEELSIFNGPEVTIFNGSPNPISRVRRFKNFLLSADFVDSLSGYSEQEFLDLLIKRLPENYEFVKYNDTFYLRLIQYRPSAKLDSETKQNFLKFAEFILRLHAAENEESEYTEYELICAKIFPKMKSL